MANIGKIGTKVMSELNHASLSKYANNPEIYIKDTQHLLKKAKVLNSDKFERLANEINATKEKYPISELQELKVQKAPLWKWILGKIFG